MALHRLIGTLSTTILTFINDYYFCNVKISIQNPPPIQQLTRASLIAITKSRVMKTPEI
ncbi:hypothetical protein [Sporomusa acidovorans]|uniref:hypothetical protein n=1 Tax=Sporomusa acidovorans TaxID=112900 RepID=UPI0015A0DE29|nr:hypothetical protein [Sporomusa acidovorans]